MPDPILPDTSIVDSLKTAVLLIDQQQDIVFLNTAGEEYLQISNQQIAGRPIIDLFENKALIEKCLKRLTQSPTSITVKEVAIKTFQHQRKIVTCTINRINGCSPDNPIFSSIEFIAESQFSILESDTHDNKNDFQSSQKFIQGMTHEIKNPLGGIRGAAQLLSQNLHSREDIDYINIILYETARLADLVDRMSGYIKNKKMLPLNIHRILEHVYKLLSSDSPDTVMIKRDYDPSLPEITGSESSLAQAFINLGLNALHAIGDKGVVIIRSRLVFGAVIENRQYKQAVRIDIQDNGTGIDESIQDVVFEPLVSSKSDGTGLGLSISKEIISVHQGRIEFSSRPGCTVFSVFLPILETRQ